MKKPTPMELIEGFEQELEGKDNCSDETLHVLMDYFGNAFHANRFMIFMLEENNVLRCHYEWCAPGNESMIDSLQNIPLTDDLVEMCLNGEKEMLYVDINTLHEQFPEMGSFFQTKGLHAVAVEKLQSHDRGMTGLLVIYNPDPGMVGVMRKVLPPLRVLMVELLTNTRLVERLSRIGYNDALTGVGNRQALYDMISQYDHSKSIAVVFSDLTGLKVINDTLGHAYGDSVLIEAGRALGEVFGSEHIFRIGGDEFLVVLNGVRESCVHEQIARVKNLLLQKNIYLAMGLVYEQKWTTDFNILLRRTDVAMYNDKRMQYEKLNFHKEERSAKEFGLREMLEYDLDHETYRYIVDKSSGGNNGEGKISDHIEQVLNHVYPEDRELYRTFWNTEELRKKLEQDNNEGVGLMFRVKEPGDSQYRWVRKNLQRIRDAENGFLVQSTIRKADDIGEIVSNPYIAVPSDARANIILYKGDEFFRRANLWKLQRNCRHYLMLAMDIPRFTIYNKMFGREAGNEVLELLQESILETVKKYGGVAGHVTADDFALLMGFDTMWDKQKLNSGILEVLDSVDVPVHFKPACAVYPTDRQDLTSEDMYEYARHIIPHGEKIYEPRIAFFSEENYRNTFFIESHLVDLEKALNNDEFLFYLQPKVSMQEGKVISAEALVRWRQKGRMVPPGEFIPIAEQTGLIAFIDRAVFRMVCSWIKSMLDRGKRAVPVSVNLSRDDFEIDGYADSLIEIAKEFEIPGEFLEIEVTESSVARNMQKVLDSIAKFKECGWSILMDDFGKGYSSLTDLHAMYIDTLKLDKKFVDALDDTEDRRIVESVIHMANLIQIPVIAEGVETEHQKDVLLKMGCWYAQGYYFAKPMTPQEFEELIRREDRIEEREFGYISRKTGRLDIKGLLNQDIMSNGMINSIIGPAALVERVGDEVTVIQMNEAYADVLGFRVGENEKDTHIFHSAFPDFDQPIAQFRKADADRICLAQCEYVRSDGQQLHLDVCFWAMMHQYRTRYYIVTIQTKEEGTE